MPSSEYTPTVEQVGALLRARTVDTNGNELGTFTASTRPTALQAATLIQTAVGELAAQVGADLDIALQDLARTAATYRAASLVEISYFPEQVTLGRSPYEQYHTLWLEALASLRGAVLTGGEEVSGSPADPSYAFPIEVTPLNGVLGITPPSPYFGGYR